MTIVKIIALGYYEFAQCMVERACTINHNEPAVTSSVEIVVMANYDDEFEAFVTGSEKRAHFARAGDFLFST